MSLESAESLGDTTAALGPPRAIAYDVPPGYFRVVGVPIVRGREFLPSDTVASPAVTPVVIAESLATVLFKRMRDPIGQRLRAVSPYDQSQSELEVVGVVRMDRNTHTLESPPDNPPIFVPYRRQTTAFCRLATCIAGSNLLIRSSGLAEPLIPSMMGVVREEARLLPVSRMWTLAQADRDRRSSRLEVVGVTAACGLVALVLGSIGLYAMLSVAVGQRRREIGVRVALGAHARQVVTMFFASGLRAAVIGLLLGLPLTIAGAALLTREGGTTWAYVPTSVALVMAAVLLVASLASWLPARRAARVDPMVALRAE
jgi:hypothetical protein